MWVVGCTQKARTGADDVSKILTDSFPSGFCETQEDFDAVIKMVQSVNPRSFGQVLKEWKISRHEVNYCNSFTAMF